MHLACNADPTTFTSFIQEKLGLTDVPTVFSDPATVTSACLMSGFDAAKLKNSLIADGAPASGHLAAACVLLCVKGSDGLYDVLQRSAKQNGGHESDE